MSSLRVAAVFDRIDERGKPFFSPDRQRVVARSARNSLLRYLQSAPMVLRASGLEPDPLTDSDSRVVPLHYRTDGEWVWQEACGYYLQEYGVAPESAFLAHIATRGYLPPPRLSPEILQSAGRAALAPTAGGPITPVGTPPIRYLARVEPGEPPERARGLVRMVTGPRATPVVEELRSDLTWSSSGEVPFVAQGATPPSGLVVVTEREASAVIDQWWRVATGRAS